MRLIPWLIGGISGTILFVVIVLSAMSMRPGAGTAHAETQIAASPEQIWPWLRQPERTKKWVSWLTEVRPAGDGKETWIMEDKENRGERMEIEATVLRSEEPKDLTIGLKMPGGFSGQQAYTLKPAPGGGTIVSVDSKFKFEQMVSRLLEPMIASAAKRKLNRDLQTLKTDVEASAR